MDTTALKTPLPSPVPVPVPVPVRSRHRSRHRHRCRYRCRYRYRCQYRSRYRCRYRSGAGPVPTVGTSESLKLHSPQILEGGTHTIQQGSTTTLEVHRYFTEHQGCGSHPHLAPSTEHHRDFTGISPIFTVFHRDSPGLHQHRRVVERSLHLSLAGCGRPHRSRHHIHLE